MRKAFVFAGCAVIAAVVLGFTFFRDSDEDRIRKVLAELAKIVMVKDGDTLLSRAARLNSKLPGVVDEDVRVDVAELNLDVRGRKKLAEDGAKAGLLYQQADCDFTNVSIKLDPGGTVATVEAVGVVTATRGGERKADKRDVHFLLRKDGSWKIATIDVASRRPDE
jgi:HSP20 family molecular chaperone IbpA